jgi:hypothetical protein
MSARDSIRAREAAKRPAPPPPPAPTKTKKSKLTEVPTTHDEGVSEVTYVEPDATDGAPA